MSSDIRLNEPRERIPRNHLTVLQSICNADPGQHLTAQDVYLRVRAGQPTIGFATVHRALARLHESGHLLKVDVPGTTSAVYERVAAPHAHFRCLGCGDIRDVEFRVSGEQMAVLSAQLGLHIDAESTTFAGRCARCLQSGATG